MNDIIRNKRLGNFEREERHDQRVSLLGFSGQKNVFQMKDFLRRNLVRGGR